VNKQEAPQSGIVVLILSMNQRDTTLRCLESLMACEEVPFRALVWDNGSHDETVEAVREVYPQVLAHYHPGNLGVAGGRNAAAKLAIDTFDPEYLLFLDNDILVERGFVGGLLRPFDEHEKVGQTQAKLRFLHDRDRLNDGGGARVDFIRWRVRPVGYGEVDRGQHDKPRKCVSCGGAMMVRSDLFQQLGGFDLRFNPFGPEDLDFSLRLTKLGYQSWYAPTAVAYHAVSHTYGGGYAEEYARHKMRHWFHFMNRHASLPERVGFYLFGLPYIAAQVTLREGRRGNIKAVRGLMRGAMDLISSEPASKR
jgi:GT2 family glycosyltransferase